MNNITYNNNNTNIISDIVCSNYDHLKLYMCILCTKNLTTKPESLCEQCLIKTDIDTIYDLESDYKVDITSNLYKIENLCYDIIYKKPYIITNIINNITNLLNLKCYVQSSDVHNANNPTQNMQTIISPSPPNSFVSDFVSDSISEPLHI